MSLTLRLAWRNIWRNKRRSIITILAVTFAVTLSIAMRGIQLGTYEVNIRHVVELFTGYLQIQRPGYQENPTLRKSFRFTEELSAALAGDKRIISVAPRIVGDGLASLRDNSQGAVILGIDPVREASTSRLRERIVSGRFLESAQGSDILIGETLMQNLNARIGDQVVLLAQGIDGSLGNDRYTIAGSVRTGMPTFDRAAVFMGLHAAQDLLLMDDRVSLIAVRLSDLPDIAASQDRLNTFLGDKNLCALAWNEIMPDFEQGIQLDNISGMLMLAILIVVVAFGITNTVLMAVTERFREFGIILSLGMPHRMLVRLVLAESLFIIVIGIVLGNILAVGINLYLMEHPIVFSGAYAEMYETYGFLPRVESTLRLSSFVNTTLSILAISLASTLYPLSKVFRLEPLKGIRYT